MMANMFKINVHVVPGETITTVCVMGDDFLTDTAITVKAGDFIF